jgi:hypothetical protein
LSTGSTSFQRGSGGRACLRVAEECADPAMPARSGAPGDVACAAPGILRRLPSLRQSASACPSSTETLPEKRPARAEDLHRRGRRGSRRARGVCWGRAANRSYPSFIVRPRPSIFHTPRSVADVDVASADVDVTFVDVDATASDVDVGLSDVEITLADVESSRSGRMLRGAACVSPGASQAFSARATSYPTPCVARPDYITRPSCRHLLPTQRWSPRRSRPAPAPRGNRR